MYKFFDYSRTVEIINEIETFQQWISFHESLPRNLQEEIRVKLGLRLERTGPCNGDNVEWILVSENDAGDIFRLDHEIYLNKKASPIFKSYKDFLLNIKITYLNQDVPRLNNISVACNFL